MQIEITVPDEWTPALALATRALLQQAVRSGCPLVTCARPDATPEQLRDVLARIQAVMEESGLAA